MAEYKAVSQMPDAADERRGSAWMSCAKVCSATCCCLIAFVLVMVFGVIGPTTASYYWDVVQIGIYGYGGAACRASSNGCQTAEGFPGLDTDSVMTYALEVKEMELLPSRLQNGEAYRGNELGNVRINSYVWPGFALGANETLHDKLRPIYDDLWGTGASTWSKDSIRSSARRYLRQVNNTFTVKDDIAKWVELELHKLTFGVELSKEQLDEFLSFQSVAPLMLILPEFTAPILHLVPAVTDFKATQQKLRDQYLGYIKECKLSLYCGVPAHLLPSLASAILDALTFAGGLSVPQGLTAVLALFYSDQSPAAQFSDMSKLSDEELEAFVFEAVRLYPPVIEFPWFDAASGRRKLMIEMKALRDTSVWGKDANDFRLRSLDTYHRYGGIAWVEPANGAKKQGNRWLVTNSSRGCPGQDLSMAMMVGFLQEWRALQEESGEWSVSEQPAGGITFTGPAFHTPPVAQPFVLTRRSATRAHGKDRKNFTADITFT